MNHESAGLAIDKPYQAIPCTALNRPMNHSLSGLFWDECTPTVQYRLKWQSILDTSTSWGDVERSRAGLGRFCNGARLSNTMTCMMSVFNSHFDLRLYQLIPPRTTVRRTKGAARGRSARATRGRVDNPSVQYRPYWLSTQHLIAKSGDIERLPMMLAPSTPCYPGRLSVRPLNPGFPIRSRLPAAIAPPRQLRLFLLPETNRYLLQ